MNKERKGTKRLFMVILLLVAVATGYFVAYPLGQKSGGARSMAGQVHRDAGIAKIGVLQQKYEVLSNDYDAVLAKLEAVTGRVAEVNGAYVSATAQVTALTEQLAELNERLEHELQKNAADEQEIVTLEEQLKDMVAAVKEQKKKLVGAQREQERLMKERVDRSEYDALKDENDTLATELKQESAQSESLKKQVDEAKQTLLQREEDLAALRTALDTRKVNRELMTSVVAAQLRLLEYDVDRAIKTLTQMHNALTERNQGGITEVDLKNYDALITECLKRLRESRQVSEDGS